MLSNGLIARAWLRMRISLLDGLPIGADLISKGCAFSETCHAALFSVLLEEDMSWLCLVLDVGTEQVNLRETKNFDLCAPMRECVIL